MPQGEAIPLMRRRRRCSKRPPGGEGGGRGITVNIVHPGSTTTDMNPADGEQAEAQRARTAIKRYGKADDLAALVAFVAGPEAGSINGAGLTVDGGVNARRVARRGDERARCRGVAHAVAKEPADWLRRKVRTQGLLICVKLKETQQS